MAKSDKNEKVQAAKDAIISVMGVEIDASIMEAYDNTKVEDMVEVEPDVWKGSEEMPTLFGVYVGKQKSDFTSDKGEIAHWHFIATRSPIDGNPFTRRVLGTTVLERAFSQVSEGMPVFIEYKGTDKTRNGNEVTLYSVKIPKKAMK